jgi:serine/threonine protein kinase
LSEQQISNIIDFFGKLNQPRQAVKYHLPGYETVEYLSQRAECVELIARPVGSRVRGLNRFRIFRPPTQITGIEKERFIKRAYNSLNAVSQIGDHPHILKVWVIKNEDGDIIEGSDWSEVGTLRDLLERRDEPICVDDALKICQGIALALHKAHQVGVIHRAIKPEHILLMNGIPKLINFDMSYQIEENRLTLITDVSKIKDDGYIAPEILAGQDIDESTDYFSLGTIAFELLTGAKAFASTRAFVAQGGFLGIEAFKKLQSKKIPEKVIEVIKGMITAERIKRLKNGTEIIKAFSGEADNEQIMLAAGVNFRLRPGAQYDVFEIIEMVGEGSEAQIYKARTVRGKTVALKLYNKEISRDKIFKEAEITSSINSAYVVHCENKIGYWNNERFFLVLDFIEGNTMRQQIERLERPDLQLFQKVALGLMEAIKAYHEDRGDNYTLRPIVHGDIKPDNIIITQDGKPVLFDFGIAGEPRVDVFQGTASYVPPDSILGADMRYAQDSDLFSLGVTLWEWFFGTQPYSSPAIGDEPQITEEQKNLLPDEYLEWLLRAVGTEADKRFSSVEEMYSAFIAPKADSEHSQNTCLEATTCTYPDQDEPIPEQSEDIPCIGVATELEKKTINPFVYYLNTLTNVSAGNENATAEAQVKNEYFDRISVDNPLTQFVFEKLINERKNLVLTGNAGDGKTTIAAQVIEKIFGHRRQLKAVEFFPSYNVKIIKDMSEIEENERPSILREVLSDKKNAYLIVSNTGTLLQSFKAIAEQNHEMPYEALESTLLKALASDSPQHILNDRFLIVNIGNISSINTACEVFSRMLENQNWDRCDRCNGALNCPILFNVRLLQAKRVTVRARVMLLYRRLYEYNVRLTMRQMIGHLAFSITGGYTCADVNAMSHMALHNNLPSFLFHNLFFGDNGEKVSPLATQLLPVRKIRNAGFGSFLEAFSERRIWMDERINPIHLIGFPDSLREKLCNLYSLSNPDSRRQARRMLFFFGLLEEDSIGNRFISIFLDSPMLRKFIDFCDNTNKLPALEELKYRARVIQVLQEFFTGLRLPEDKWQMDELFITLNFALGRPAGSTATQIILANYRINDFELIIKTLYKVSNESRRVLCLRTKQGNLEMILDLPFLDYVARRYEGEVTGDLSQYYADRLERFKVKLLELYNKNNTNEQNLQLLAAGTDRSFRIIKITVADGNLEVM